jgi:hypothetical protein
LPTVSDLGPAFRKRCLLAREIDADLVVSEREGWQKMIREFISDAQSSRPEDETPSVSSPEWATVRPSHSIDIEGNLVLPQVSSTLTQADIAPSVISVHSTRPSTPSLVFTNFTFPSLNDSRDPPTSPRTPPKQVSRGLHHDHHPGSNATKASYSPKSKTRALVTMLRAAAASKACTDTTPVSSPSSSPRLADSPSSSNASHNVDLDSIFSFALRAQRGWLAPHFLCGTVVGHQE